MDKNFDKLAGRFEKKVYGGLKGQIRLAVIWRDLQETLQELSKKHQRPLSILDVGGGLGQTSIRLAEEGHFITLNDISEKMLEKAKESVLSHHLEDHFTWHHGSYQSFLKDNHQHYDLVLCHALMEWLDEPQLLLKALRPVIKSGGKLSLCFYNPDAKTYRNLIRGNFDWLQRETPYQSDSGSLTPNTPCEYEQVAFWLEESHYHIQSVTGLRVFHDYVVEKRGGHQHQDEVLTMELQWSTHKTFKWLGRYLHIIADVS